MKIVIDLDEKYYNDIKNSPTASNYSTLYALFGIRNGTLLSEELEKLKAEIKQQGSIHVKYRRTEDIDHLVDSIVYQCKDSFCNYIDNSIKELKGEKNEH